MADINTAGALTNVLETSSAKPVPIVEPQIKDEGRYTGGPINLKGNRINYSREEVDQFRLKFGTEAQTQLAKDAVMSYALTDFKEEMSKDNKFLTYDGLINGTATILNYIDDPKLQLGEISGNFKDRPNAQKKMNSDEILKFFTTLEDVDLTESFTRELFKAIPSTAAFLQTTKMVGKKLLESGPPTSYGQAIAKFGVPVLTGLGASVFTYSIMDNIDEFILGPQAATTPDQRTIQETVKTFAGMSTGLIFPFMITKGLDWGTKTIIENLGKDGIVPGAVKLSSTVENFLKNYSTAYRGSALKSKAENIRTGVFTGISDSASVGGATAGAYAADTMFPGEVGPRIIGEIAAGGSLPVVATKASAKIANFIADKFTSIKQGGISSVVTKLQEDQMTKIIGVLEDYKINPKATFEHLSIDENIKVMNQIFPELDLQLTVAQLADEPILTIIEAALRASNKELDIFAANSSRQAKTGIHNFIKLMGKIDMEPQDAFGAINEAGKFRRSAIESSVGDRVKKSINSLGSALALINKNKNFGEINLKLVNQKIHTAVDNQLKLIRTTESKLWKSATEGKAANTAIITTIDPDNKPAFLTQWALDKDKNKETQELTNKALEPIAKFVSRVNASIEPETSLTSLVNKSNAALDKININKIPLSSKIEEMLPNEITGTPNDDLKNLPNQLYEDPTKKILFNYKRAFSNTEMESMQQNYTPLGRDFLKLRILNAFLKDPKNNLTKAQTKDMQDYATMLENAQLQRLLKDEKGGVTLTNVDPELRFAPSYGRFLKEKGYTGVQETSNLKPITVAELISIRTTANKLARDYASGATVAKDLNASRIAGNFSEAILKTLDELAPGMSEKYKSALDFSVGAHSAITRTIVGKTKTKKTTGATYLNPEHLLGEILIGKPSVVEMRTGQLLNLSEFAVEKVGTKQATRNQKTIRASIDDFLREARKDIVDGDVNMMVIGDKSPTSVPKINETKLKNWLADNEELLKYYPNLKDDLSSVQKAQRLFTMWDARSKKVDKSLINTTYLSKMIDNRHPIAAIEQALNNTNFKGNTDSVQGLIKLFRPLKGDEQATSAMMDAVINKAFIESGGSGGFINAKAFYNSFYAPFPDNPSVNLMGMLESQKIITSNQSKQIKWMSTTLLKIEAADRAGNLIGKNGKINETLVAESGAYFDFAISAIGSAGGTRVGKLLTGGSAGPASMRFASSGANLLRNLLVNLPASEKINLTTELFTNPQLFLNFIKKPRNAQEKLRIDNNIIDILSKAARTVGFDKLIKATPTAIRELGEEDDTPTDETLEYLERRDAKTRFNQQSSVQPGIAKGTPTARLSSNEPFLSGLNTAPAGGGTSSAAPANPNQRSQYASLFPNDLISGMIQPTATMAEGGAVPPREVDIKGQAHMLAYITPQEGGILQLMGGSGRPGPMGIPSYYANDANDAGTGPGSPDANDDDTATSGELNSSTTSNNNSNQEDLGSGRYGVTQVAFSTGPKAGQTVSIYGRNSQNQKDSRRDAENIRDAMMNNNNPNVNKMNLFTVNKNPVTRGLQKASIYGPKGPNVDTIQSLIDSINVQNARDARDAAQQPQSLMDSLMSGINIGNVNVSPGRVGTGYGVKAGTTFAKGGPVGIASLRRR